MFSQERGCPTTRTESYCLMTEGRMCEQLAQGRYLAVEGPGVELVISRLSSRKPKP